MLRILWILMLVLALAGGAALGEADLLRQYSDFPPILFHMALTGGADATAVTPAVQLSKGLNAFEDAAGSVSHIGNGWYTVRGDSADTGTLGDLIVRATAAGCTTTTRQYRVVAFDPTTLVRNIEDRYAVYTGRRIYVNPATTGDLVGSDSNGGLTADTPKLTVAGAVAIARPGDEIFCEAGRYWWPNDGAAGTLSTRTSDTAGVLTMSPGHGWTTGLQVAIVWDGGERDNATISVSGNAVTFSGGAGAVLPAQGTVISGKNMATESGKINPVTVNIPVGVRIRGIDGGGTVFAGPLATAACPNERSMLLRSSYWNEVSDLTIDCSTFIIPNGTGLTVRNITGLAESDFAYGGGYAEFINCQLHTPWVLFTIVYGGNWMIRDCDLKSQPDATSHAGGSNWNVITISAGDPVYGLNPSASVTVVNSTLQVGADGEGNTGRCIQVGSLGAGGYAAVFGSTFVVDDPTNGAATYAIDVTSGQAAVDTNCTGVTGHTNGTILTVPPTEISLLSGIKERTTNLPDSPAAVGSAMALTSGERTTLAGVIVGTQPIASLPSVTAGNAGGVALVGSEMDLVDAPNATAVTAINSGQATAAALAAVAGQCTNIVAALYAGRYTVNSVTGAWEITAADNETVIARGTYLSGVRTQTGP